MLTNDTARPIEPTISVLAATREHYESALGRFLIPNDYIRSLMAKQLIEIGRTTGVVNAMLLGTEVVGFCNIQPEPTRGRLELNVIVAPSHERKGIGSAGVKETLRMAFEERGIQEVFAVSETNRSGAGLAARLGFAATPTAGREIEYRICKEDWEARETAPGGH